MKMSVHSFIFYSLNHFMVAVQPIPAVGLPVHHRAKFRDKQPFTVTIISQFNKSINQFRVTNWN